jgi:hypothetical protein
MEKVRMILVADSGAFVRVEELVPEEITGAHVGPAEEHWTCAVLDTDGLFVGVAEVKLEDLTPLHLPRVTACDLDAARGYRWMPTPADLANAQRGRFDPVPRKTPETKFDDAQPLPALACFFVRAWLKDEAALPAQTLAWTDQYVRSVDFKPILEKSPEAQKYWLRRGLKA